MAKWTISEAQTSQVGEIAALVREIAPLGFAGVGTLDQLNDWLGANATPDAILPHIIAKELTTVVALDPSGAIIGTGYLRLYRDANSLGGYLGGIYCRLRGQGLGRAIIQNLAEVAQAAGASHLELNVSATNQKMLSLVAELGFCERYQYLGDFFVESTFISLSAPLPLNLASRGDVNARVGIPSLS